MTYRLLLHAGLIRTRTSPPGRRAVRCVAALLAITFLPAGLSAQAETRLETDSALHLLVENLDRIQARPETLNELLSQIDARARGDASDPALSRLREALVQLQAARAVQSEGPLPVGLHHEAVEFFEAKVRPVLLEHCASCHGAEAQKGGLRLDSSEFLTKGAESGPVVVPGDPESSHLIRAIRYSGALKMPPNGKIPDEEIQALVDWIQMGAPWPAESASPPPPKTLAEKLAEARSNHWAFQPIAPVAPPTLDAGGADLTPVDSFIAARLEQEGLHLNSPADRRTLIRRLSFDITGLPPTYDEVESFASDVSPDATEKLVDRLLASPHFGERWARHWLDIARYSDTKGYVFQEERAFPFSHTYRDYVIRAFNEDLPYNEFVIQQIAADQMELGEDKRALAAMGYLTLGRRFIGNIHDIIDDRIDVVARGFMGLTVSCARCHDHKYDPIPTEDYYSLYGVFRSSTEPNDLPLIETPDPDEPLYVEFLKEESAKEAELESFLDDRHTEELAASREKFRDYLLAAHDAKSMTADEPLRALAKERDIHWQQLEEWRTYLQKKSESHDPVFAPWVAFSALSATDFIAHRTATAALFAKTVNPATPINTAIATLFDATPPESMAAIADGYGRLVGGALKTWTDLVTASAQKAMISGGTPTIPTSLPVPDQEALRQILFAGDSPANFARDKLERLQTVPVRDQIRDRRNAVARVEATHPGRPDRAMVLNDSEKIYDPFVFTRGKAEVAGDKVPRRFLALLTDDSRPAFKKGSGRLEMARAIASPTNPLTSRVYVNRVWMHLFGKPLVDTPSDFGVRADPPSHPELLDYLAWRFIEDGWSTKKLIRSIVLSRVYQQSSIAHPGGEAADAENRLLWRQNRRRVDFEAMRDYFLAAAGSLDEKQYGPSVDITEKPYPTRRTVYSFIERQNLPNLFRTFDFAGPDAHSPRRFKTTVPQQALYLLNGEFVAEQASTLSLKSASDSVDAPRRIRSLYRTLFQRNPTRDEIDLGVRFVAEQGIVGPPPEPKPSEWRYGYGRISEASKSVVSFTPLPHFIDDAWQGGPALPDPTIGWCQLGRHGGHPGGDADHSVIRRWIVSVSAEVSIEGELKHESEHGDGVTGYIVSSREGIIWSGAAHNATVVTEATAAHVQPGDTFDLVIACGANENSDSFVWHPRIFVTGRHDEGIRQKEWLTRVEFTGPPPVPPKPLEPWDQYVQVLLVTNEFFFVD